MAKASDSPLLGANRTINIGENKITFAMPENFSRDMPAEPIIENLNDDEISQGILLGQRWWDINKPGWFGKELGTLMMRINVHPIPENRRSLLHSKQFDPTQKFDFLLSLDQHLIDTYPKGHDAYSFTEVASLSGDQLYTAFDDKMINGKNWVQYVIMGQHGLLIDSIAIPLSDKIFIEVTFEYAANQGVLPREFNRLARATVATQIENTLNIELTDQDYKKANETWLAKSINDIFLNREDVIIPTLFGAELRKLPHESLTPKLKEMLGLPKLNGQ